MAFTFTPATEEEMNTPRTEYKPWPDGEYDAEILAAGIHTSKTGNQSIKINVKVFNNEGHTTRIFDYLSAGYPRKLKHACQFAGFDYGQGAVDPEEMIGKSGRVKLKTDPAKDGYPAKNVIDDYLPAPQPASGKSLKDELSDEIPF